MDTKDVTMAGLGTMVLGVVLIIVLFGIIPMIGELIDTAVTIEDTSEWSIVKNDDMPTGHAFWSIIGLFVTFAAIMLFVGIFVCILITAVNKIR
jgi:hypothetical protein